MKIIGETERIILRAQKCLQVLLKTGDTVLIEYASKDNSVARVIDKYYMKKYHYLKH